MRIYKKNIIGIYRYNMTHIYNILIDIHININLHDIDTTHLLVPPIKYSCQSHRHRFMGKRAHPGPGLWNVHKVTVGSLRRGKQLPWQYHTVSYFKDRKPRYEARVFSWHFDHFALRITWRHLKTEPFQPNYRILRDGVAGFHNVSSLWTSNATWKCWDSNRPCDLVHPVTLLP